MNNTSLTVTALLAGILMAAATPAIAAGPAPAAKPAKPSPCGKDQVELTSKITGATRCAAIGGITPMWGGPGPQPIILPEKPAAKPKK